MPISTERRRIETDKAPPSTGFRSQALIAGGLLFTGGMIGSPMEPEGGVRAPASTLGEQVDLCLRHLEQVTLAAGVDKSRVIEVSAYMVDISAKDAVEEQVRAFLGFSPLLFNIREVSDCAMHGMIEMDWIAVENPIISAADAAWWIAPLGHEDKLSASGPFLIQNGLTAPGASLGEQSYGVLELAASILKAKGSGLEHLVKLTVYIADFESYPQFNDATRDKFANFTPPTRSVVVAPQITGANLVKVDLVAMLRGSTSHSSQD